MAHIHNPFNLTLDEETNRAFEWLIQRIDKLEQELTALGAKVTTTVTVGSRPKRKKAKQVRVLTEKQRAALTTISGNGGLNTKTMLFAASTLNSLERRGYISAEPVSDLGYDYPPYIYKITPIGKKMLKLEGLR